MGQKGRSVPVSPAYLASHSLVQQTTSRYKTRNQSPSREYS